MMSAPGIHLLRCLTPLHNGSGEGLGDLDRPIVREVTTKYPYVQGKTIKGAALARAREQSPSEETAVAKARLQAIVDAFGSEGEEGVGGNQGAISAMEAQLLLFPVRSLAGTFAWATNCLCLARFAMFLELAKSPLKEHVDAALARQPADGSAIGTSAVDGTPWDATTRLNGNGNHILEGLVLQSDGNPEARNAVGKVAEELATSLFGQGAFWPKFFKERLLVLSHDDFGHLTESATVVEPNIRIGENGVTKTGSLRFTEFLPAESILFAFYDAVTLGLTEERRKTAVETYETAMRGVLQLGADESAGKGLVRVTPL